MTYARLISDNEIWLNQIFAAKSVNKGGVVRRSVKDVERKIGLPRLRAEVEKRGFHMLRCGNQYIIICDQREIRVLC